MKYCLIIGTYSPLFNLFSFGLPRTHPLYVNEYCLSKHLFPTFYIILFISNYTFPTLHKFDVYILFIVSFVGRFNLYPHYFSFFYIYIYPHNCYYSCIIYLFPFIFSFILVFILRYFTHFIYILTF